MKKRSVEEEWVYTVGGDQSYNWKNCSWIHTRKSNEGWVLRRKMGGRAHVESGCRV